MTANRFFLAEPAEPQALVRVEGREHHHLRRVARVREGDVVGFFDGRGAVYEAVVESSGRERTMVRILSRQRAEQPRTSVKLAMSMLKPQVMESVIRSATELLVSSIAPVISERSAARSPGLPAGRRERWERIAREAAKQSKTGLTPDIRTPADLEEFLVADESASKIFLSERGGVPLGGILTSSRGETDGPPASACLLVGPEGGWSAAEETTIRERGFQAATLGRSVLRAETAALCALSLVCHFWVT
jgi:16S rRNA (uracil1498-N3)-methyltransferase